MDQVCERLVTGVLLTEPVRGREKLTPAMDLPHTKTVEEVFEHFEVTEEAGLNPQRVTQLREQYGLNGALLLDWYRV